MPGCAAILVASLVAHTYEPSSSVEALLPEPLDPVLDERLAAAFKPEDRTGGTACRVST
ncbi:hypothetical protein ABZT17_44855 [Streptomyces sp. NPDC005648]|uniref:hypothetical protein n=1 Tax=Streptomyces sp. NPDC005648 TaxID=3157044 RepID=UPI00339EDD16